MIKTKQEHFLIALRNKLKEMEDPNPDIITHDSYTYHETTLAEYAKMPKIRFHPYGKSKIIKAEIMRTSNIYDEKTEKRIDEIKEKYKSTTTFPSPKQLKEQEDTILANRFDSYWNNYWRSIRTALNRINQAQKIFITTSNPENKDQISEPMRIMMGTKAVVPNKEEKNKQENRSYMDELMELE